jgi:rod shape-determining protein MreC
MRLDHRKRVGHLNFQWSMGYYVRIIAGKLSYSFLLISSLFLLFYHREGYNFDSKIRNSIAYQLQPFFFIVKNISLALENSKAWLTSLWSLKRDNIRFQRENFDLRLKLLEFELIQSENSELRGILDLVSQNYSDNYTIKKINTVGANGIIHSLRFSLDKNDNIAEHDLVLDKYGNLVGRVINVSDSAAEILLISDYTSKIPAKLENSRIKVILGGNGGNILDINYFFNNEQSIIYGENVYTSDDGNILQEGILIGRVMKMDKKCAVKINSDLASLNFVVVVSRKPSKD